MALRKLWLALAIVFTVPAVVLIVLAVPFILIATWFWNNIDPRDRESQRVGLPVELSAAE